jgi:ATP-dependent Clp protease ATP-binding subunit ClpA
VFSKPLGKGEIEKIVRLFTQDLAKRLQEKQLSLSLDQSAVDLIIEKGYDPIYGARPLKRFLQRNLESALAKSILAGNFEAGDTLTVCAQNGELSIKKA